MPPYRAGICSCTAAPYRFVELLCRKNLLLVFCKETQQREFGPGKACVGIIEICMAVRKIQPQAADGDLTGGLKFFFYFFQLCDKIHTCGDFMFKIGNVTIKNNIVLAPMAGVCNSAFRKIIKEMGCGLIYAEMVSDKGLVYDSKKTKDMLYFEECERPIVQQIFGSDLDTFVEAAKMVEDIMHPDIIDINMGCPVPKVAIKSQAGAALLKNPQKIYEIVSAVVKSVNVPVTVKIRSGWDNNSINAVEVAKIVEKAGASAICVHGRTRSQGYSGTVNLDIIKAVKESVDIPVIGNGDIKDIESAKRMFSYTGCDAIMIGRGVLGNPWLIKELVTYFDNGTIIDKPSYKEKIDMCFHHMDYLMKIKPEKVAVLEMRSHIAWYLKGMNGSQEVKNAIFRATNRDDIEKILNNYLKKLENSI